MVRKWELLKYSTHCQRMAKVLIVLGLVVPGILGSIKVGSTTSMMKLDYRNSVLKSYPDTEVGQIIVADVDYQRISELLAPDQTALRKLICRER